MNVTSDTLFHFTNELDTLLEILKSNFKSSFCKEHFVIRSASSGFVYIPMVSFCDIPLGQITNHINKYGGYGIGMSKKWGVRNGLNPVMYLSNESTLAHKISAENLSSHFIQSDILDIDKEEIREKFNKTRKDLKSFNNSMIYRLMYIKNYQYDLIRKDKVFKDYRFYDEREWRFVPDLKDLGLERPHDDEDLFEGKFKKGLIDKPTLNFEADDIKYLIVKDINDVSPLINEIKKTERLNFTDSSEDILFSKIITVESLEADF
jgi:hypothetical protein